MTAKQYHFTELYKSTPIFKKLKQGIPFRLISLGYNKSINEIHLLFHSKEYKQWLINIHSYPSSILNTY